MEGIKMYKIIGIYQKNGEVLDTAETLKEAQYMFNEYRIALGKDWDLTLLDGNDKPLAETEELSPIGYDYNKFLEDSSDDYPKYES